MLVLSVYLTEELTDPPWKVTSQNLAERKHIAAIWASPNVQRKKASRLRIALIKNCHKHPKHCIDAVIKKRYKAESFNFSVNIENMYGKSIFCLNPPGDSDIRKGIFDSILMGCIPVLFTPQLLSYRYEWYFTRETEQSCAVFVNSSRANTTIEQLLNISKSTVLQKQQCIERIAPTIAYGLPPKRLEPYIGFGGGKTRYCCYNYLMKCANNTEL